jgi:cysteine desulfurase
VALITTSFQAEAPLHPAASSRIQEVFSQGWADPTKLHDSSRHLALLLNEAKTTFASAFGVQQSEIYFLGEPPLAFHLGISGLLENSSTLYFSGTDRQPVFAIVDGRTNVGLASTEIPVSTVGGIEIPDGAINDLLIHQPINPETGIIRHSPETFKGKVFVDNSAYGLSRPLPSNWSAAMWQSRAWQGPSGLAILAIREKELWRNPLPHNDPSRVPQAFSIPLAIISALALEGFTQDAQEVEGNLLHYKKMIINFLETEIGDVVVPGKEGDATPYLISASFAGVDSERILSLMSQRGIAIDAGSACLSGNMKPSHVLAAMGLPTTGNIRITLHPQVEESSIDELLRNLKEVILREREL